MFFALVRLASLSSVSANIFTLFHTSSFIQTPFSFRYHKPLQFPGIYRFCFHLGPWSSFFPPTSFPPTPLTILLCSNMISAHFNTPYQAPVSWLACTMISLTFFNTLWLSWYTFRLFANRLCVLFTIRLPDSPILYPRLCWSSIHIAISLIQNPTGE